MNKNPFFSRLNHWHPLVGVGLMIASTFLLPFSDGIAKYLAATHSVLFLLWARFLVSTLFAAPMVLVTPQKQTFTNLHFRWQTARAVIMVVQLLLFFEAISRVPLTDALGALFVAPIVATIIAVLFLKEPLTHRKLIAIGLGFPGAMLVVQPGTSMNIGMLYALGSGVLYACFMILTRIVGQKSPPFATLSIQSLIGTILLTPFVILNWEVPTSEAIALIVLMAFISVMSYVFFINAFRLAQASLLSPLMYFELVGATLIGYFFFDDFPTLMTWIGIFIIVLGGLSLLEQKQD